MSPTMSGDFDARGELGVGGVCAGYQEIRYVVTIDSPASTQAVADLLATAERHSPYLDVFSRGQSMKRIARINGAEV